LNVEIKLKKRKLSNRYCRLRIEQCYQLILTYIHYLLKEV